MKQELLKSVHQYLQDGLPSRQIAHLVGMSHGYVSNLCSYFNYGSYEEVEQLLVKQMYQNYSLEELTSIAEEIYVHHVNLTQGVMKYKLNFNRLQELVCKRKEKGSSLELCDLNDISWAGTVAQNISAATVSALPSSVVVTPYSVMMSASDLTSEEIKQVSVKEVKIGRAKAIPKAYRSPKKALNKAVVEGIKQQQRILNNLAAANDALQSNQSTEAMPTVTERTPYKSKLFKGHPALKFLSESGEYLVTKGRPPYIDPHSEGFDKLPHRIRELSIKRSLEDAELECAALQELSKFSQVTTLRRYGVYLELKQKFSHIPKSRIFAACELAPSREKELQQLLTRPDKYLLVKEYMKDIYRERNGKTGRITMALELRRYGVRLCDQTVRKLMKQLGLKYECNKKKHYSSYTGESSLKPNVLHRDFVASRPFEKVVTDVTMINCCDKPLFVSINLDLCTKEIVSASGSDHPTAEFVLDSTKAVLNKIKAGETCIIHSDQGCQYQSAAYQQKLSEYPEVVQSMSRKGNCYDNGAAESFFSVMKNEVMFRSKDSYDVNLAKVLSFIEFYNKKRLKPALNGMSPTLYRQTEAWKSKDIGL